LVSDVEPSGTSASKRLGIKDGRHMIHRQAIFLQNPPGRRNRRLARAVHDDADGRWVQVALTICVLFPLLKRFRTDADNLTTSWWGASPKV
jgi:hypothetical protein